MNQNGTRGLNTASGVAKKHISTLFSVAVLAFVGCGTDSNDEASNELQGTWELACTAVPGTENTLVESFQKGNVQFTSDKFTNNIKTYTDSECTSEMLNIFGDLIPTEGKYKIGKEITLGDGTKVQELDVTYNVFGQESVSKDIFKIDGDQLFLGDSGDDTTVRSTELQELSYTKK